MAENKTNISNPATLSGTHIRKGGQIYADPTTPAGGKQVGDSPDQAKMRGTSTQKAPIVREATKPIVSATITPQGLAQPEMQAAGEQRQTAETLQQLGGYADRVRQIAATKVSGITGDASLKAADADTLTKAFGEDAVVGEAQIPISEYLEKYAADIQNNALTPEQKEAALVELSTALQQEGMSVTAGQLAQWYNRDISETVGQTAATQLQDTITFAEFGDEDWASLGFQNAGEVADILGIDEAQLTSTSVNQLDELIETKRQQEFNQIEELQRQLAAAPPGSQVAQQIKQRLADLSGAGVAATERQVEELVETLATDVTVEIGGQEYAIEEMLSDDNISQFVEDYLALSPEDREGMFPPGYEGFKDWVDANEQALQAIVGEQQKIAQGFEDVQADLQGFQLQTGLTDEMMETFGIDEKMAETMTSAGWQAFQEDFNNSNIGQIVNNYQDLGLNAGQSKDLLSRLQANYDQVGSWDAQTLTERYQMARDIDQNLESTMGQLAGDLIKGDFVSDADLPTYQNLRLAADTIDTFSPADRQLVTRDRDVVKMLQENLLTPELLERLPENLSNYNAAAKQTKDYTSLLDEVSENGTINKDYRRIQDWMKTGDPAAKAALKRYRTLDSNKDGIIDKNDIKLAQNSANKAVTKQNFLTEIVDGVSGLFSRQDMAAAPKGMYATMTAMLEDGGVDRFDAEYLLDQHGDKASQFLSQFDDVPSTTAELAKLRADEAVLPEYIQDGRNQINSATAMPSAPIDPNIAFSELDLEGLDMPGLSHVPLPQIEQPAVEEEEYVLPAEWEGKIN